MSSNRRFTAYLSERERTELERAARALHTSENFIVRTAIRAYLRLDEPSQVSQLSQMPGTNSGGE